MTPRTLATFAAGALLGSLVQAVYDARGESRPRDLSEHEQKLRKELLELRDTVSQTVESACKPAYKPEDFVELGEQLLDGFLSRGRLLALFEPICKSGDLGLAVRVLDALVVVHRVSPSSSGRTGEGSGAGGIRTPSPAPTSGVRS